jgi:RNA-directed DNA polymerase
MEPQSPVSTNTKLKRIAWLSKRDFKKEFECLMHLFNQESLTDCFNELGKNKAVGIDGVTKMAYGENLCGNIKTLITNMKKMAYRPGPVREVLIPKDGQPGAMRPLGISNLEDKVVQTMMQKVLESIYEPLFLDCSHGFRPGRSCHTAIKALHRHLYEKRHPDGHRYRPQEFLRNNRSPIAWRHPERENQGPEVYEIYKPNVQSRSIIRRGSKN